MVQIRVPTVLVAVVGDVGLQVLLGVEAYSLGYGIYYRILHCHGFIFSSIHPVKIIFILLGEWLVVLLLCVNDQIEDFFDECLCLVLIVKLNK